MTANELRKMKGKGWDDREVDRVIENLGNQSFQSTEETTDESATKQYY